MTVALIYTDGRDRWLPVADTGERRELHYGGESPAILALVRVQGEGVPREIDEGRLLRGTVPTALEQRRASARAHTIRERRRRHRRQREDPTIRTCPGCGATWCVVPGVQGRAPAHCSPECRVQCGGRR